MNTAIKEDEKFCQDCGGIIKRRAEICPKCGIRQLHAIPSTQKNRIVAAILALTIGGLGIHKFYMGRKLAGVMFLIFCWTGVPMVIGLVEGIILLCSSDSAFEASMNPGYHKTGKMSVL